MDVNDKDVLKRIDSKDLEYEQERRAAARAAELLAEHSEHSVKDLMSDKLHSFAYKEAVNKLVPVLHGDDTTARELYEAIDLGNKLREARDTLTHWHAYY